MQSPVIGLTTKAPPSSLLNQQVYTVTPPVHVFREIIAEDEVQLRLEMLGLK